MMHTWFIVYTNAVTETIEAEDLDDIWGKLSNDYEIRSVTSLD